MPDAKQNTADPSTGSAVDEFIDRGELARRLDVHERTISRMIERGELPKPCLGAGGRPRWLWSHVMEHCRSRHQREQKLDQRKNRKLS